jgi:uncharacterized protein YabN with tetrapyrrole methylase and pyrophosphatase domain
VVQPESSFAPGVYVVGAGVRDVSQITLEGHLVLQSMDLVVHLDSHGKVSEYLDHVGVKHENVFEWYREGENRTQVYDRIATHVLALAEAGHRVSYLAAGNPGFLDTVAAHLRRRCDAQGIPFSALPGVSSIDTLLTELFLPGSLGLQMFEATAFCRQRPRIDPRVPLLLFQPGMVDDDQVRLLRAPRLSSVSTLQSVLIERYPPDQKWILVASPEAPGEQSVQVWDRLDRLDAHGRSLLCGTLLIPGEWWPRELEQRHHQGR